MLSTLSTDKISLIYMTIDLNILRAVQRSQTHSLGWKTLSSSGVWKIVWSLQSPNIWWQYTSPKWGATYNLITPLTWWTGKAGSDMIYDINDILNNSNVTKPIVGTFYSLLFLLVDISSNSRKQKCLRSCSRKIS